MILNLSAENCLMMISIININKQNIYKSAGAILCVILWETSAQIINKPIIVPAVSDIVSAFFVILSEKKSYIFIGFTCLRILTTLLVDSFLAFIFGVVSGLYKQAESFFYPVENILKSVPSMSILLLSLIWFKSEVTPLFVTSLIVFPILYRGIVDGVNNIDQDLEEMSSDFKVSFFNRFFLFYLPSIKPFLKNAYIIACGFSVKVMISAEVLSQPQYGIGTAFQIARVQINTAGIFAWAIISIFMSVILQAIVNKFFTR